MRVRRCLTAKSFVTPRLSLRVMPLTGCTRARVKRVCQKPSSPRPLSSSSPRSVRTLHPPHTHSPTHPVTRPLRLAPHPVGHRAWFVAIPRWRCAAHGRWSAIVDAPLPSHAVRIDRDDPPPPPPGEAVRIHTRRRVYCTIPIRRVRRVNPPLSQSTGLSCGRRREDGIAALRYLPVLTRARGGVTGCRFRTLSTSTLLASE
jgi:hypothetical protein